MGNAQPRRLREADDVIKNKDPSSRIVTDNGGLVDVERLPSHFNHPAVQLNEEQKKIIFETWKVLEQDIGSVGIIVFINLFETYPEMQNVFLPFTGMVLDDLKNSKQLRAHALRVMGAVQKAVFRLNEPAKLETFLRDLGRSHTSYGAKCEYMDYIGSQFLSAIRPSLDSKWTPEVEEAWASLIEYMVYIMKDAFMNADDELKRG